MEIEKSYLYTHLGHSVYSDIEKIDNAIDLIVESMIAYKDNELKKLRVGDVSVPGCDSEWHESNIMHYGECTACGLNVDDF